jgi:hypothetical protein
MPQATPTTDIADLRAFVAGHVHKALAGVRDAPRLFQIEYDNRRVKSKNPWTNQAKMQKHMRWGTQYPNGMVTLESGICFRDMDELRLHFEALGEYTVTWEDEASDD